MQYCWELDIVADRWQPQIPTVFLSEKTMIDVRLFTRRALTTISLQL